MKDIIITKHYLERFFERILSKDCTYNSKDVINKMESMMSDYEYLAFQSFKTSPTTVKLPFGREFHAVVQKNVLITCYKVNK
tara:strand:- start:113 stop:358 length:246 start_codon:yes stop_codon:yes gene_type:complete